MLVEAVPGYEQVTLSTLAHYENKGRASELVVLDSPKGQDTKLKTNTPLTGSLAPKKSRKPRARRERKIGIGLPSDMIERNSKIISGLQGQYSRIGLGVELILDQARTVFHTRVPNMNNPEIYELFEDGDIDQALDILGAPIWVIGRPSEN